MRDMPLVCICIPTYNAAVTVGESLQSILAQSYTNLVVHIVDNASTDNTLEVISKFSDSRIRIHLSEKNVGAENNFTKCIQLASGKYTAIFHADDIYHPDMLAKQVDFLENKQFVGAVFTEAYTIDESGKRIGATGRVPNGNSDTTILGFPELFKSVLKNHNFLVCPSVLVRTEVYKNVIKVWDAAGKFRSSADVDTWFRLSAYAPIGIISEKLMSYRISNEQFSSRIRNRTTRTDFFLVMDDYLSRQDVLDCLSEDDLSNYQALIRHEKVAIALNLMLLARVNEAKEQLATIFTREAVKAAIHSRRGKVTLLVGMFLRLLICLGLSKKSIPFLKLIKNISWR